MPVALQYVIAVALWLVVLAGAAVWFSAVF